jgi:hypothetical protein
MCQMVMRGRMPGFWLVVWGISGLAGQRKDAFFFEKQPENFFAWDLALGGRRASTQRMNNSLFAASFSEKAESF